MPADRSTWGNNGVKTNVFDSILSGVHVMYVSIRNTKKWFANILSVVILRLALKGFL